MPTAADEQAAVFDAAAELFAVLSTPIRLRIISAVCEREKNVSELLAEIDTTQPNMSQHLATLYRCGVLAKRREGTQSLRCALSIRAGEVAWDPEGRGARRGAGSHQAARGGTRRA